MANNFVKTHKLNEQIKLNENGTFDVPLNLFEDTVLKSVKVKPEQYKELVNQTNQFHAGIVQVAGEQVTEHFKTNPDISEIGISYDNSGLWSHNTVFTRGAGEVAPNVVTAIETHNPELQEIQNSIIESFKSLDN